MTTSAFCLNSTGASFERVLSGGKYGRDRRYGYQRMAHRGVPGMGTIAGGGCWVCEVRWLWLAVGTRRPAERVRRRGG